MKRLWLAVDSIDPWDYMHQPDGDGFKVDAEKDGQTTEEHRAGIDFIKQVLERGQKIRPILVAEDGYGQYVRLDGFKRWWAHKELGYKFIEAFVCSEDEHRRTAEVPYGDGCIRCEKGGLPKEQHGLFEGAEGAEAQGYENTVFLFKSPNPEGLRIELSEAIHVHWGQFGKFRFVMGRKDFEALAGAIATHG